MKSLGDVFPHFTSDMSLPQIIVTIGIGCVTFEACSLIYDMVTGKK